MSSIRRSPRYAPAMTATARRTLIIVATITVVVLVGSLAVFAAGQPDAAVAMVLALSAASSVAAAVVVIRRAKDEAELHDFWLTFNAKYRTNLVATIGTIVFALLLGAAGLAVVSAGYAVGWALPLYSIGLVAVSAFTLWAGHRPFGGTPGESSGETDGVVPRQGLEP